MCLVQILVVAANIQIRVSKAEVEQGSMCTAVGHVFGDPGRQGCSDYAGFAPSVERELG